MDMLGDDDLSGKAARLMQFVVLAAISGSILIAIYARRRTLSNFAPLRRIIAACWIGLLVFSELPAAFTLKRLVVVVVPYTVIAVAVAIDRWPKAVALALVTISVIAATIASITFQRDPWRSTVQHLAADKPTIIWVDDLSVTAFDYYWRQFDSFNETRWAPLIGRALRRSPRRGPL